MSKSTAKKAPARKAAASKAAPRKAAAKPKDDGPTKKELLADLDKAGYDTTGLDGATKDAIARILAVVSK